MQIYHYHPETHEYLSSTPADLDPLETELAGEPRYLVPAQATEQTPPEVPAGHAACWTGQGWELVEDHRGELYWLPEDDWQHEGRGMETLGALPAGATMIRPEMPEDMRLERLAVAVRDERDRRLTACDYLMMPDYALAEAERAAWAVYRQALRDLPQQAGFPWAGPDDGACPWPSEPEALG
ncbi:tail fiber assembly protein [Desulfocurvibacter africanus]|uniref:Phage tail assembly chaperone-like domain-containing protein n=1 Tax=Desulfocurvibacter africanus subsp. africanus str. Walvis Bay TaxID=690850 RepID=F3YY58_DESAF|nr:tail fiber assembly protein [Desulfocurvibacter africanus]EGJ51834.1 hypothetical protein Desaf_3554 [Desulfocurvibacter africanus subsp. africanus str. Walvis Bay]